jgi:hydrogenase 3 maturation protease
MTVDLKTNAFNESDQIIIMKTAVCGIGNRIRGDDAVGPLVIDELKKALGKNKDKNILLLDCGEIPEGMIKRITAFKPHNLVLVDTADLKEKPGTFREIDPEEIMDHVLSTHKMPLTMLIKFLRSRIDFNLIFIGIQPRQTALGDPVSMECKIAVRKVSGDIEKMIKHVNI